MFSAADEMIVGFKRGSGQISRAIFPQARRANGRNSAKIAARKI
jgi:hypothetical protein